MIKIKFNRIYIYTQYNKIYVNVDKKQDQNAYSLISMYK